MRWIKQLTNKVLSVPQCEYFEPILVSVGALGFLTMINAIFVWIYYRIDPILDIFLDSFK